MKASKRILIISDINYNPVKMVPNQANKLLKGFVKLGHHVSVFSYCMVLSSLSPFKSRTITAKLYKKKADELLIKYLVNYQPDIVLICFPRGLDYASIIEMKNNWPKAVYIGNDNDAWPKLQKSPKIQTAKAFDILTATNNGRYLQDYRDAGVPFCVFMPNMCDPDIDHRYEVSEEWKTDILWTGKAKHHADSTETLREELVERLSQLPNCTLYGCRRRPKIGGINYLYAISGARIGVNVNAVNSVKLYHSDRLTHYLACGTCVLAKKVPDSDLLFEDGVHLRYFDTVEEFFELADWYLEHEAEREKIARAGMQRAHTEFNCEKIAQYLLDVVEKGRYDAPWAEIL